MAKRLTIAKKNVKPVSALPNQVKYYQPDSRRTPPEPSRGAPPEEPVSRSKRAFKFVRRSLAVVILLALILAIIIAAWDARNISRASQKMFGTGNIFTLLNSGDLKTDQNGRVNVLLMGYSVDDPNHPGAKLTDSIIVLSMIPKTKTGFMLSIPRDLYVQIPGHGYGKINEAYQDGGPDLLEQIVKQDFKLPASYYAIINYAAVRDVVNALGGVTVNIKSPDPRGLFDPNISPVDGGPLKLSNGPQKLNGQTALNLTRARGDAYNSYGFPQSDFDRTEHQRQILAAIKAKLNWKLILNPRKNSQILDAVADNVKTDLPAGQVRPLFGLFNKIPGSQLKSLSLRELNGQNYLASTYYEGDTLTPAAGLNDYSAIDSALQTFVNQ